MTLLKDAWETLRLVAALVDKVTEVSSEIKALRTETRELRDRIIRIETIIEEARRRSPARSLPPGQS